MRRRVTGAAAAAATAGLMALLGACAPDEPTPTPQAGPSASESSGAPGPGTHGPLQTDPTATGTDGVGGLGFDVVALDPDGDGLVVHRLGDR